MFDITSKAVADTGVLELFDANDEPLIGEGGKQCTITLHSPGSKEYAKAKNEQNNRIIERLKKKGKGEISTEAEARQVAEFLAQCTISIANFDYPGEFSNDRAKFVALYVDGSLGFIKDQVNTYLGDWGNFTTPSAKK